MFDRLFALETFGIKLGLENIRQICTALDHPERSFLSLHVAGTNGKGSVTAMAHAALLAAGLHAARYTSPHLSDLAERFVVGDSPVDAATLAGVTSDVLDCIDNLRNNGTLAAPPTFFEATTAIAFEVFRRARIDVAVIEVGLGGRFDATNVIEPVGGAITSIALDHQEHLGRTLETIAFEKAGIIKPKLNVAVGDVPVEALAVITRVAHERNAQIVHAVADTDIQSHMEAGRANVVMTTPSARYGPLRLALRGAHQIANAAVAIRLLEIAGTRVSLTKDAIERGLATVEWPARLELLALPNGKRLLLDAAHNVEGAHALAAYLAEWHPERPPLVVGVMRDKDVDGILRVLLPHASTVIATAPPLRRGMDAAELAARVAVLDPTKTVLVERDPTTAAEAGLIAGSTVCVAGSIVLAGAVREAFRHRAILH